MHLDSVENNWCGLIVWLIVFKSCLAEKNVTKLQMPACVKLLSSALSQTTNEADSAANLPLLLLYEADRAAILLLILKYYADSAAILAFLMLYEADFAGFRLLIPLYFAGIPLVWGRFC